MPFPAISDGVLARHDVPGPRYTSYPTVPAWHDVGPEAHVDALTRASEQADAPLSLYMHLPFCERRCTYCGCNVVITENRAKADRYLDAIEKELDLVSAALGSRRGLSQVHWGGGTPTFLDPTQIERAWSMINAHFHVEFGAEVAIEVDPAVTSVDQLELLADAGFNRISFGVQDFDPRVQETVNRVQSKSKIEELYYRARSLGFTGINFDLIYGLPFQSSLSWAETLSSVIELRPDRLAVYSFAYLPDRQKHQRKLPVIGIPQGKEKLALFAQAWDAFTDAGYQTIGMDHFALPDDELSVAQRERRLGRNFQGYTVRAASESVALGVSGISRIGGLFVQNLRGLTHYYDRVDAGLLASTKGRRLTPEDERRGAIITSLMCNNYVDLGPDAATMERELTALKDLEKDGLLKLGEREIELTELGKILMRRVAMVFDTYLADTTAQTKFSRTV